MFRRSLARHSSSATPVISNTSNSKACSPRRWTPTAAPFAPWANTSIRRHPRPELPRVLLHRLQPGQPSTPLDRGGVQRALRQVTQACEKKSAPTACARPPRAATTCSTTRPWPQRQEHDQNRQRNPLSVAGVATRLAKGVWRSRNFEMLRIGDGDRASAYRAPGIQGQCDTAPGCAARGTHELSRRRRSPPARNMPRGYGGAARLENV